MRLPKYISLFAVASFASMPLAVRAQDADRKVEIERIEVRGTRLLKDIGIQRTRLDTVALHDNIALSMGDVLLQNTNTFIKPTVAGRWRPCRCAAPRLRILR